LIVIDASLALEIAIAAPAGRAVNDRLEAENHAIAAPEIIELEVLQTLRRLCRQGLLDQSGAGMALRIFGAMEIERYSHAPLRRRIWELRDNLTAYDAAYVALAELLDAPLWTRDEKFRSVPGHGVRIEIL
jgi:predicted nucleic acid-binding protein